MLHLTRFLVEYMLAADGGQPVVLVGVMSSWPAMSKWQDMDYLCSVAGPRTVPVEVGKHYLDEGWGQQLMLFSDFIKLHVLQEAAQHCQHPLSPIEQDNQTCPTGTEARSQQQLSTAPSTEFKPAQTGCLLTASQAAGQPGPVSSSACGRHVSSLQDADGQAHSTPGLQLPLGYLAQHPLFDQIPALKRDIQEPEYCALGRGEMQSINAWFGPAGTVRLLPTDKTSLSLLLYMLFVLAAGVVMPSYCMLYEDQRAYLYRLFSLHITSSCKVVGAMYSHADVFTLTHLLQVTPLHHDPHYNLLAQVVGCKYVRLYHSKHTAKLHPYGDGLTQNSSQIDVDEPQHSLYPEFAALPFYDCVLQPGQMLFIPPGWWHYVKALRMSFSVSFWWK